MSPVKKILAKQKPIKPSEKIFEDLLSFFKIQGGIDVENKLFQAELYNIITKSTAEEYTFANIEKTDPYKALIEVAKEIKSKSNNIEEASKSFISVISQFEKTFTITPHPNFVMIKDTLQASRELKEFLANPEVSNFLSGKTEKLSELTNETAQELINKTKNLQEKIKKYPQKNLTPKEESLMLVKSAEHFFDSRKITVDTLDKVHEEVFGFKIPLSQRAELTCSELIVWRDQDSKPGVTKERISRADQVTSKVGMQQLYALLIADIMKDVSKESPVYAQLENALIRTLNTLDNPKTATIEGVEKDISDQSRRYKLAEAGKSQQVVDDLRKEFLKLHFPNFHKYVNVGLRKAIKNNRPFVSEQAIKILKDTHLKRVDLIDRKDFHGYHDSNALHSDLKNIVDLDSQNIEADLAIRIADLSGSAKQFGLRALISENRQNEEQFREAFDFLKSAMYNSTRLEGLVSENDTVDDILQKSFNNKKFHDFTIIFLQNNKAFYEDITTKLTSGQEISEEEKKKYLNLDILYTRSYYSNLEDSKRSVVIAESRDSDSFKIPLLFEQLTKLEINKDSKVTEIKFLFENPEDIFSAHETVKNTFSDKIVENYQIKTHEIPKIFDKETGQIRNKTIADVKREKGLKNISEEDKQKDVKGTITIMLAGSDSLKGMGLAAKYIMEFVKWQIAKVATSLGYDVDFKRGNGPSPVRDSSENLDKDQTTQGVETNNTPKNFAYRTLNYIAHKAGQMFNINIQKDSGEINFGNSGFSKPQFEAFENNPEEAERIYNHFKNNVYEKSYKPLYEEGIIGDKKNNSLNSFYETATLSPFSALCNLAARDVARVGAKGVNVKEARAIGFANALSTLINHLVYPIDEMTRGKTSSELYNQTKEFPILNETFFNQATFGVLTANVDLQWKLIDTSIERTKKGQATYIKIGDNEYSISNLTKMNLDSKEAKDIRSFFEEKYKNSENKKLDINKLVESVIISAHSDRKYNIAVTRIKDLWKECALDNGIISQKEYDSKTPTKREAILKLIPKEHADYLNNVFNKSSEAIQNLSEIMQYARDGKVKIPKKIKGGIEDPSNIFEKAFENIATIMTLHEFTSPAVELKLKNADLQQQINQNKYKEIF